MMDGSELDAILSALSWLRSRGWHPVRAEKAVIEYQAEAARSGSDSPATRARLLDARRCADAVLEGFYQVTLHEAELIRADGSEIQARRLERLARDAAGWMSRPPRPPRPKLETVGTARLAEAPAPPLAPISRRDGRTYQPVPDR